jgi:hypothetical protein
MTAALFFVVGVVGVFVVVSTFSDVFQSVIVPRPARRRLRASAYISRWGWHAWRWIGHSAIGNETREDFLGTFAPLLLVGLLAFWVGSLIFGYGCIFYALRSGLRPAPDFSGAIYFAGTSLLTVGFGDIVPVTALTRYLAIVTGASGFGIVAIVTTFLFAIFGAYQSREAFVVAFCNRAGAPPSGVELVEIHARMQSIDGLAATLRDSHVWLAAVLETHLAYPVLNYFRSTHDDISWVGAVGAILDASTILITAVDVENKAEAKFASRLGRHFVNDFAHYFRLSDGAEVGVERIEFDVAYDRLAAAGLPMLERDAAWRAFAAQRSTYASQLNAMAQYWRIPPAQWVGDRSLISHYPPLRIPRDIEVAGAGERHESPPATPANDRSRSGPTALR